jgi:Reverse transcriptase (RNA-dependent DNA polymerase)
MWTTGEIPTELTWTNLVLIPKDNGDKRGIGLLETVWKLMESIISARVMKEVQFYDCLHVFRHIRGTGTAILEAKLVQELACNDQEPLFYIFLDLRKAYDTIDRTRALAILEGYGVGPNTLRLFKKFWEQQQIVARQSGFHGPAFQAE